MTPGSYMVEQGQVDLVHVQAAEVWVKMVGGKVWMALGLAVPSRLWLGGVLSPHHDEALITALVQPVRACARHLGLLVCVAGLASDVTVFKRVFRVAARTGRRGRPRLELAASFLLGQVVKRYTKRRVTHVEHRIVTGTAEAIDATLAATESGTVIMTAFISLRDPQGARALTGSLVPLGGTQAPRPSAPAALSTQPIHCGMITVPWGATENSRSAHFGASSMNCERVRGWADAAARHNRSPGGAAGPKGSTQSPPSSLTPDAVPHQWS